MELWPLFIEYIELCFLSRFGFCFSGFVCFKVFVFTFYLRFILSLSIVLYHFVLFYFSLSIDPFSFLYLVYWSSYFHSFFLFLNFFLSIVRLIFIPLLFCFLSIDQFIFIPIFLFFFFSLSIVIFSALFIFLFLFFFFYYITKYLSEANVLITSYPMPALRRLLHHLPHTIHVTIATPSCFVGSLRASWQPVTRWVVMSSFLRVCIDVKRDTFYGGWKSWFDSIFVFLVLCCL